jgi:hypothetical protein
MISSLVEKFRKDGIWQHFEEFFTAKQNEIIKDMRSGAINTTDKLIKANTELDMLERLKSLDLWK